MRPEATVDPSWTDDFVHVGDVSLRYLRSGDGPPFVIAHGFKADAACFSPLVRALAPEWDVVAYDARGHGRSDAPPNGYRMEHRIADLRGLVEALDLGRPVLFGTSMGGATAAWAAAAAEPGALRATVLVEPGGLLDARSGPEVAAEYRDRIEQWEGADRAAVAESFRESHDLDRDLAARFVDARLRLDPNAAAVRGHGYPDLGPAFDDIACPTLLVFGAESDRTDGDSGGNVDRLADGQVATVPGAGHTVFPDAFEPAVEELTRFLETV